jgi:hypothetical protein
MKKKRINTYDLILAKDLGTTRVPRKRRAPRKNLVLSKSLDDGEVLAQKQPQPYQEYVVGLSAEAAPFEEYVVGLAAEEIPFEEYVVGMSAGETASEEYIVGVQSPGRSGAFAVEEIAAAAHQFPDDDATVRQEMGTDLFEASGGAGGRTSAPSASARPQQAGQQTKQQASPDPFLDFAETYSEKDTKPEADEDDFINDMKAILSGEKTFDPVSKKAVDPRHVSNAQSQHGRTNPDAAANDGHAIFKKISENMQYANAYDLGTVELENRFSDFDRIEDIKRTPKASQPQPAPAAKAAPAPAVSAEMQVDHADFIRDLDAIAAERKPLVEAKTGDAGTAPAAPDTSTAAWPPRPTTIRPYTSQEKIAAFGQFAYEADPSTFGGDGIRVTDNWKQDNIISVSIPQLNGKRMGRTTIANGTIQFHKDGADRLRTLWAAWEQAGLLDRILTFEGGYAARFIRHTQSRSPRPLSNHAWGTAFDINASWNGFGAEPALVGREGCVRELVSIANSHGFFWGGHFRGNKDGMHFELGKTI